MGNPKYKKLNALITEKESDLENPTRVNPLQLYLSNASSLLCVELTMQGMVDTRATHNLMKKTTVTRLGLTIGAHISRVKALNSQARPVMNKVSGVSIGLGE